MSPALTVIIPTLNRCDLLGECLDSLANQTRADFAILVVDDGSSEDIEGFVGEACPGAQVVQLPRNRGFATAVNAGIRAVDGGAIMLLNNDMTLEPDCIETLMRGLKLTGADVAAPLVLWKDDPGIVYSAGDAQRVDGRPESIGFREPRSAFEPPQSIFGASAGAAIYRAGLFAEVGLFDEKFIAYFEDSDLNFRLRLAGKETALVPEAVAYHEGSASLEGRRWWRAKQCFRNHDLLVFKNMPLPLFAKYFLPFLRERGHQMASLVSAARTEFGLARALIILAAAVGEIVALLPHCCRERRKIRAMRTLSTKELDRLLTPMPRRKG